MIRSEEPRDEMDKLRQMTDANIDYSDIPETDDSWFGVAELALEFVKGRLK